MPFKNIEDQKAYQAKWYNENKDRLKIKDSKYYQLNKNKINKKRRERIRNNPDVKIVYNLRRRIHHVVKDGYKSRQTLKLLGCTLEVFMKYLESQFQPGMSFENYGKWHIDHIKPCSSFDLTDATQQSKCFHYTNLQPLWAVDNLKKGAKNVQQNS